MKLIGNNSIRIKSPCSSHTKKHLSDVIQTCSLVIGDAAFDDKFVRGLDQVLLDCPEDSHVEIVATAKIEVMVGSTKGDH